MNMGSTLRRFFDTFNRNKLSWLGLAFVLFYVGIFHVSSEFPHIINFTYEKDELGYYVQFSDPDSRQYESYTNRTPALAYWKNQYWKLLMAAGIGMTGAVGLGWMMNRNKTDSLTGTDQLQEVREVRTGVARIVTKMTGKILKLFILAISIILPLTGLVLIAFDIYKGCTRLPEQQSLLQGRPWLTLVYLALLSIVSIASFNVLRKFTLRRATTILHVSGAIMGAFLVEYFMKRYLYTPINLPAVIQSAIPFILGALTSVILVRISSQLTRNCLFPPEQ